MDDISNNQDDLQSQPENPAHGHAGKIPAQQAQAPHSPDEVPPAEGIEQDQADSTISQDDEASQSLRAHAAVVEAILFSTDAPMAASRIATVAEITQRQVKQAIKALNLRYEEAGCSFRVEEIGGGYQMLTQPEFHETLSKLSKNRSDTKLTQAGLETLAIVAYRQPILRADVEAIRGVAGGEVIRSLLEKQLIKIVGRAEVIGRPMLYGTTRLFLDVFGLGSLEDLPRVEELRGGAKESQKHAAAKEAPPVAEQAPQPEVPQEQPQAQEAAPIEPAEPASETE